MVRVAPFGQRKFPIGFTPAIASCLLAAGRSTSVLKGDLGGTPQSLSPHNDQILTIHTTLPFLSNSIILDILPREGDGTPLQYSCLENPRDGGAWWAAIYGVTQSQT